ncbi:UNVERIFIED_CONTAM: hypothetical protein HDU68_002461 [Siphonaria sp. JEL0065]|nr:hypothetical protein HDU68_002461 [Siphonaria sp. JEL0065]
MSLNELLGISPALNGPWTLPTARNVEDHTTNADLDFSDVQILSPVAGSAGSAVLNESDEPVVAPGAGSSATNVSELAISLVAGLLF